MEPKFFKDAKEFGKFLKKLREEANLTIRKLDDLSGVSHSYISQLERGDRGIPSPEILSKLAGPLKIEYENLMIFAGYIDGLPQIEKDPISEFDRILARAKKWLFINEELEPTTKKNIEFFLEANKVTSITPENLFEKLEEFIENCRTNTRSENEDFIYFELFDMLNQSSENRQFNNQNLDAIIAYSSPLTYNGHVVTDNDRKLIINFLEALFSIRE